MTLAPNRFLIRLPRGPMFQNGTTEIDELFSVIMTANGSVIMSGMTSGSFSDVGVNKGNFDMVVIKLDAHGTPVWSLQVRAFSKSPQR